MSGTGRRGALPPVAYRKSSNLSADGLVVHAVGQGGQDHGSYDFRACPGLEAFKRELVAAFTRCASASGTWGSARTCLSYAKCFRQFLAIAAARHPPVTTVTQLTAAVWNTWTLPKPRRRQLRVLLVETVTLPAGTRARMLAQRTPSTPRTPPTCTRAGASARPRHQTRP